MSEVQYKISHDQKPTEKQIEMLDVAEKRQNSLLMQGKKDEVYDEDCPETDPVTTPARYAAMMKAVEERNRRIASNKRKRA